MSIGITKFIYKKTTPETEGCRLYILMLSHFCAERSNRKFCLLEALQTEGNTDNRTAVQNAFNKIHKEKRKTAEDNPKDIHNSVSAKVQINRFAEGEQGKPRQLKRLNTEGNTDNRTTPNDPQKRPHDHRPKAGYKKPKKVTYTTHL